MRRAKILIVDDREVNRYIRKEILKKAGYECIEAATADAAWQSCLSDAPDLALLDVHLPDRSGVSLCRQIKTESGSAKIMVIQISASAVEVRDAVLGLDAGADDYLIDPVDPDFLLAKVRSLLRIRKIEEDLRHSNEDLEKFAYVASHDLQEPLRNLSFAAQRLQRDCGEQLTGKASGYVADILAGVRRMNGLIQDLLEYSRVSSEPGETMSANLDHLFSEAMEVVAPRLKEVGGTVSAGPLPVVEAVPNRMVQVFVNLLENAVKYRRPDVPLVVEVAAEQRGSHWRIAFRDNGQGFDQKFAAEIFGLFKRLHGPGVSGSGIGLAICKVIVERGGGKIWAESVPNEGATFILSWPAVTQ